MKTIKVNWANLEIAFERNSPNLQSFIDEETGEIVSLAEGMVDEVETRKKVASNLERYVKIESASSREQYSWMEQFVATVEEKDLRERLMLSIDGKGAFRRFKDVLVGFPTERERWFNYRSNLIHYRINEWFASKELVGDPPPPWGEVTLPAPSEVSLEKPVQTGSGIAEVLRSQIKGLIDLLPSCELQAARDFLEYLKNRS